MGLLTSLGAGALSLTAMAYLNRAGRWIADAEAEAAAARAAAAQETERLKARVRALQGEVETLSAIREVALIANDDVSFERILAEVLKVLEDLLESSELAIFLADDQGAAIRPRALRRGGAAQFAEGPATSDIEVRDGGLALEAWRLRRTLRRVERGDLLLATLLYADAELSGVLAARVPAAAARSEEEMAAKEAALEALAKHVALAIKKPTLYDKAVIDSLTRLHTKRHFTTQLARACAQARRTAQPFALVLCDVDHFKRVNDTHGHLTGDLVLAEVAAVLRSTARDSDECFRYGGEEMVVLAPGTDAEQGRALAERLRAAIEARPLRTVKGEPLGVTASFGVAAFGGPLCDPQAIVAAADKALYRAKADGRNRVCGAGQPAGA